MKIFLMAGLCVSYSVYAANIVTLRPHEQWWQYNVLSRYNEFEKWLGDMEASSRIAARKHVVQQQYKTILDIPSGLCVDYFGYKKAGIDIEYTGVDLTPKLVDRARKEGVNVVQGNIENIPFEDNSFDVAYARHILEHLEYYQKGLSELIRVASKEVLVVFFIKPHSDKDDVIDPGERVHLNGFNVYHNRYNKEKLEQFVLSNAKVESIEWEDVTENENILHIYLRQNESE